MNEYFKNLHFSILSKLARKEGKWAFYNGCVEFIAFGYKQAISCIFPGFILILLAVSHVIPIGIPRYDFILICALLMQVYMYRSRLETKNEVLVITVFHLLGLTMEIYKVHLGSWSYPEFAYTKVFDVPLYGGFMYASVASYITQAWKHLDFQMNGWPNTYILWIFTILIYGNFFTNAFWYDIRWFLVFFLFIAFWKAKVCFNNNSQKRHMPMMLGFFLVSIFIWIAENIGTYFWGWKYAYQEEVWQMVSIQKLWSWFLLVIVSVVLVYLLKNDE